MKCKQFIRLGAERLVAVAIIESKKGSAIIQSFSEGTINQESVCPSKRGTVEKRGLKNETGLRAKACFEFSAWLNARASLPNFSDSMRDKRLSELFPSIAAYSITQLNIAQRRRLSSNASECLPKSGDSTIEGRGSFNVVAVSASFRN
jgi:hypothetical protein